MSYKPAGYNDLSPYLVADGARKLIEFLKAAFDGEELRVSEGPDGTIRHAEVKIGDSVLMLADAGKSFPAIRSVLHVYVPDAVADYQQALAAGATSVEAPAEHEGDPDRRGTIRDPFGNHWSMGTQKSQ
jgi:uncharacterized glyoxalase superfamily protein PhnB